MGRDYLKSNYDSYCPDFCLNCVGFSCDAQLSYRESFDSFKAYF